MALYDAVDGYADTAPARALRLMKRAQYVNEHPGWTYRDYDAANAGDIWFDEVYRSTRGRGAAE